MLPTRLTDTMRCYGHKFRLHDGKEVNCGQCLNCRINKRREWTARILLEAASHPENGFITLKYDDDHLPEELQPSHLRNFIKRYRKKYGKIRYFGVGEYGSKRYTERPHYHLALFGHGVGFQVNPDGTFFDPKIQSCWEHGHTTTFQLNQQRAHYIAGYTTKKWTKAQTPELDGKYPEFSRMSFVPGIGAERFLEYCTSYSAAKAFLEHPYIPRNVRINNKFWPVGRYLREYVHKHTGYFLTGDIDETMFEPVEFETAEKLERVARARLARAKQREQL